jgi:YggT family protein
MRPGVQNPVALWARSPYLWRRTANKGNAAMTSIIQILLLIIQVAWFMAIVHIILSWLINFQVINLRQPIVASIWDGLNKLLDPIYGRIRRFLPDLGGIDLAPLVFLIGLYALEIIIRNNAGALTRGF